MPIPIDEATGKPCWTEEEEKHWLAMYDAKEGPCWACKGGGGWIFWDTPRGDDTPDTYGPESVDCPVCFGSGKTDRVEKKELARMSEAQEVWRGEASDPAELAEEIEVAVSRVERLPDVDPIEVVTITLSAANRELLVKALRAYRQN